MKKWDLFALFVIALCLALFVAADISRPPQAGNRSISSFKKSGAPYEHQGNCGPWIDQNTYRNCAPVDQNTTNDDQPDWPSWIEAASAVVTVILTCGLVFVASAQLRVYQRQRGIMGEQNRLMKQQARIMSGQLELSRDTAIRQLRAYICMVGAHVKLDDRKNPIYAVVEFKNSGQTPAYNVRIWIGRQIEAHPLTVDLLRAPGDLMTANSVVAPGAKTGIRSAPIVPRTTGFLPQIGTKERTLYAYGQVTYVDAFGKPWETNFRLIYGGEDGGHPEGLMQPDTEGNEAT